MLVSKPELCSSKTKKTMRCQQLKGLSPLLHAGTRALQLAACPPWGAGGQGGGTPGCPRGGCRAGAGLGGCREPARAARSALPSPPGSPLLAVSALCEPGGCDLKSVSAGQAGEKGLLFRLGLGSAPRAGWGEGEPGAGTPCPGWFAALSPASASRAPVSLLPSFSTPQRLQPRAQPGFGRARSPPRAARGCLGGARCLQQSGIVQQKLAPTAPPASPGCKRRASRP